MSQFQAIKNKIDESNKIVFLTGAGVSTESGIPDFRSANGIWNQNKGLENYLTKSYYQRNPKDFWLKYKEVFDSGVFEGAFPNGAHTYMAALEKSGKKITVLTQNIDGLHQKAGSTNVLELHGNLKEARCPKCKTLYGGTYLEKELVPRCEKENKKQKKCGFILKPELVLFGDLVKQYKEAELEIKQADLFIAMGTSLKVGPVNELPAFAGRNRVTTVLVNNEETLKDEFFDLKEFSPLAEFFKELGGKQ